MFKRLHIRLTLFCTFISGLILLLMSLICISFSEAEARESYFSNFELKAAMLIHQIESQSVLSLEWFSQLKADTKFEMDIQDIRRPVTSTAGSQNICFGKKDSPGRIRTYGRVRHLRHKTFFQCFF